MKSRFHSIQKLLSASYQEKDNDSIKSLAFEYLNLAAQNKGDWNYGNAIHQANLYLGLIELEQNNIDASKGYLIKAALTPGSPQLKTFGPNMLLAKKMLEEEQTEIVLEYIRLCKTFWSFWLSFFPTRRWKKEIKRGEVPDFGAHLFYYMEDK